MELTQEDFLRIVSRPTTQQIKEPEQVVVLGPNEHSGVIPGYVSPEAPVSTGEIVLNGHKYILRGTSTIVEYGGTSTFLNTPTLGIRNHELFYFESGTWTKLAGTNMQTVIEQSLVKKQEPVIKPIERAQVNNTSTLIKQVDQIHIEDRPVNVDHLTMQKFPDHQSLFDEPLMLLGLGILGMGIFILARENK